MLEVAQHTIGFRTVEIIDSQLSVNGQPILIQGVNRHEHDFTTAYGNFNIIFDHFPRVSQLRPTPHALCAVLYLVLMLIVW